MGEATGQTAGEGLPNQETLAEVLAKPIAEEEARKMVADIDVQLAQIRALRVQKSAELSQLEYQLAAAEFERAVVFRRVLNKQVSDGGEAQ